MPNGEDFAYPFPTRKMLAFEYAGKFQLRIKALSTVTGIIDIVGATREGIFKFSHTLVISDNPTTELFNIPDLPIWLSVIDRQQNIEIKNVYVNLDLIINDDPVHALLSGYVYLSRSLSWPYTDLTPSDGLAGKIINTASADPAVTNDITLTVPDTEMWRVLSISFSLTTGGTAGNRRVHVELENNGGPAYHAISSVVQSASTTMYYTAQMCAGFPLYTSWDHILIALPQEIICMPGDVIRTNTEEFKAGDNFSAMSVTAEKFMIPLEI